MRARTYAAVQCARESIGRQISLLSRRHPNLNAFGRASAAEKFHRFRDWRTVRRGGSFIKTSPLRSTATTSAGDREPSRAAADDRKTSSILASTLPSNLLSSGLPSQPPASQTRRATCPKHTKRPHPRVPFRPLESLQTSLRAAVYATGCAMPMSLSRFLLSAA